MLLTAYKPNGSQAVRPIKKAVNSHKPTTGNIGRFLSLYLEIEAKLQCRYYATCYSCDGIFWGFSSFVCSCLAIVLSMLPYLVLQLSYVFHFKANSNCRSKWEALQKYSYNFYGCLSDGEGSLPWFPSICLCFPEKNSERPASFLITGLWKICCYGI